MFAAYSRVTYHKDIQIEKSSKSVLGTTSEPRVVLSVSDNPCIEMKQWLIERTMLGVVRLYRRYQSSDYHFPATLSSFLPL